MGRMGGSLSRNARFTSILTTATQFPVGVIHSQNQVQTLQKAGSEPLTCSAVSANKTKGSRRKPADGRPNPPPRTRARATDCLLPAAVIPQLRPHLGLTL